MMRARTLLILGLGIFISALLIKSIRVQPIAKAGAQMEPTNPPAAPNVSQSATPAAPASQVPAQDVPPPPPEFVEAPAMGEDPNLQIQPDGGFIYDPIGRRDPFKSFFADELPDPGQPGGAAPIQVDSLESYDLSQLKVVAVLWNVNDPKALVQIPTGKNFMVRNKSRVGRNKGYVATIREGEVVVFELSQDGKTPATRILALKK